MGKRKAQQVAGGSKEAQVAVVGSNRVVNFTQEQRHTQQSEPEQSRYRELLQTLQTFDKTLQRWRATVCIPENCDAVSEPDRNNGGEIRTDWLYCIGYPPTTPPRIIPQGHWSEIGNENVGVEVVLKSGGLLNRFSFRAVNFENEAFKDPYTNEEIHDLTVFLQGYYPFKPYISHPPYDFAIKETTQTKKTRDLEYRVWYPGGQLHIEIGAAQHTIGLNSRSSSEVLSEPHALALFNLMDKLIPPCIPVATPQPERRAKQGIQTPKALPPIRRKPGR